MADNNSSKTASLIYLIGHIIGSVIILPILLVYRILFSKQSCYGWSVMATTVSFLGWYLSFALVKGILSPLMESPEVPHLGVLMLAFFRVMVQFFYISSYCRTLALGYHLWKMLGTLSPPTSSSETEALHQFLSYCAFAFGLPLCVNAVSLAVISSIKSDDGFAWDVADTMGRGRHWFFYLPVGIAFLASMALMYLTLKSLRQAQKDRESLEHTPGAVSSYTNAALVTKLMVLTGAIFVLDVVVNVFDTQLGLDNSLQLASFEAARTIFHADSLFWILVWNKEIRESMAGKFARLFRPVKIKQPHT